MVESKLVVGRPSEQAGRYTEGYFNKAKFSNAESNGRLSEFRKKPLIFKDRVSLIKLEVDDLNRLSTSAKKIQKNERQYVVEPEEKDIDDGVFDLNDYELLQLVRTENKKLRKELVPDEDEVEGSMNVKDQVKTHSEQPLYVSKTGTVRERGTRIGAYGREKFTERPSMRDRMTISDINQGRSSLTPAGYQLKESGDGVPLWYFKKPPTEEEENEEDDRGGFFCGICTSRRKIKASGNSPIRFSK